MSKNPDPGVKAPGTTDETLSEKGFYWREKGDVRVLVCRPLEEAGFVNGFSTRAGGVSPFPEGDLNLAGFDDDTADNIRENRRRFLDVFGGAHEIAAVWQVHGNGIKVVRTREAASDETTKADAVVSDLPGLLAGVKTADCVPVLMGDRRHKAYAAVHAGWRGTLATIVVRAFETMKKEYGTRAEDLVCAIGPAACGRSYEVGPEVIEAFEEKFSTGGKLFVETRKDHALIDLHLANREQLEGFGVASENIHTAPFCTMERTDLFFSYRVEKKKYGRTGRLLSVIGF